jgi:hypothetical protein
MCSVLVLPESLLCICGLVPKESFKVALCMCVKCEYSLSLAPNVFFCTFINTSANFYNRDQHEEESQAAPIFG